MKCFLPLVQERGAKIPAPVWELVAPAPPPPPCVSMVLHRMFHCESRYSAPKVLLSDTSYFLTCIPIIQTLAPQIPAKLLATPALLSTTNTQKSKNKNMYLRETLPRSSDVFVEPVCVCSSPKS